MATNGFEQDEKVDLSALARLSQNLYTVEPLPSAPTDAFRVTGNERAGILSHRFGPRPATEAPSTNEMDFGTGQIDMTALRMPEITVGEAPLKVASPTVKSPTKTFGG